MWIVAEGVCVPVQYSMYFTRVLNARKLAGTFSVKTAQESLGELLPKIIMYVLDPISQITVL